MSVENWTHLKTVKITLNIFAVYARNNVHRRKYEIQNRIVVRKKSSRQVRTERNDHKWLKNKEEYLLTCLETTQHAAVQGY